MSKKSRKKIQPSLQSDENPTIDALWKGLTEIDFFLLMPPESSDNRVYRTETQHILQLRGEPVESFELGIYVNVGVAGGSDFLRLGAAVLKAVHPKIKEPIAWLGRALTLCEESKDDRHEEGRSEEHTSELQSPCNLVCRLLLEKKKTKFFSTF